MSNYLPPKPLADCFKQLEVLLPFDPEDLQMEVVTEIFKCCLLQHDYFYDRSDDLRSYDRGRAEEGIIQEARFLDSSLEKLFQEYCKAKESK